MLPTPVRTSGGTSMVRDGGEVHLTVPGAWEAEIVTGRSRATRVSFHVLHTTFDLHQDIGAERRLDSAARSAS